MAGPVVTINGQLGSGREDVAALVAEHLGVSVMDSEIISQAARQAGVSEDTLRNSQRHSGLISRMLESLGKFGAAGGDGTGMEGYAPVSLLTTSSDYRELVERVLRQVADKPAVILGYSGQIALQDTPGAFHVFIHAPVEFRARRHSMAAGLPIDRARRELEASDRERVQFYQSAYHVNWYDTRLYDLVLDMSVISIQGAAELIANLARASGTPRPEPAARAVPAQPVRPLVPATPPLATPSEIALDGQKLRIRPMSPADAGSLLSLFRSLPPRDLLFLRRNVLDERVVDAWARDVADGKIITLLAETEGGKVLGEASLYPNDVPWTAHVGEVRVITSPEARRHGLGRMLLDEIMKTAQAAGIEKVSAEMMAEQEGAKRLFEQAGFVEEGRYRAHARDQEGRSHDLLVMTHTAE